MYILFACFFFFLILWRKLKLDLGTVDILIEHRGKHHIYVFI